MTKSIARHPDTEKLSAGSIVKSISTGITFVVVRKEILSRLPSYKLSRLPSYNFKSKRYKFLLMCLQDHKKTIVKDTALKARFKVVYYHDKKEGEE